MRRLHLHALLAALALLVAACGDDGGSAQDDGETVDPPSTTEAGDLPDQVVVFTPDDAERDNFGEEVTWTPSADDVAAVEEVLQDHIDDNADLGVDPIDEYHRQYVGTGDDEDVVSVQALCTVEDLDWEEGLILVSDGGSCFWQATVTVADGTIGSFTVNGSA